MAIDLNGRMKILHIITGLNRGGAEAVLYRLIAATQDSIEHSVISMLDDGVYGPKLRSIGTKVGVLNMEKLSLHRTLSPQVLRFIRSQQPDVVQTWMFHANLYGGVLARLAGLRHVVWGIHHSSPHDCRIRTRIVSWLCGKLSAYIPKAVVCCSESGAKTYIEAGYSAGKIRVIHNGFDTSCFQPDPEKRKCVRNEWMIDDDTILLGSVGRYHPHKDVGNFLAALHALIEHGHPVKGVLVGQGLSSDNPALMSMVHSLGVEDHIRLVGSRTDIPGVMNALDVHVVSSCTEAFPNVIGEAMACATPCVTTDVGDAGFIVNRPDWLAPPRDSMRLANAIAKAMRATPSDRAECRDRIVTNFGLGRMAELYSRLWAGVRTEGRPPE
jgi:glycosyltransferase involved in cell wall biosynthesis